MQHVFSRLWAEHPRPDFYRNLEKGWQCLNGPWEFMFDPENRGEQERWGERLEVAFNRTIIVPFPWESHSAWGSEAWASNDNWFSTQAYLEPKSVTKENYTTAPRHTIGWYRRTLKKAEIPAFNYEKGERVWLHIGAADWEIKIWVNGCLLAEGRSGYVPFSCDITEALRQKQAVCPDTGDEKALEAEDTATIVIRVFDPQDVEDKPLGKQHKWYTPTSGIWQPVWLEVRPQTHFTYIHLTPHLQPPEVTCAIGVNEEAPGLMYRLLVYDEAGNLVADYCGPCGEIGRFPLGGKPRLWRPEDPHLYNVTAQLLVKKETGEECVLDEVHTYFGLREIGTAPLYPGGPMYITLNGEPIYLKGALDQSFNPWGVYAWRSEEDIVRDIELAKEAGFNFLRIHIKPEDPRFYYWADRLGMLIMYDLPNLGYEGYSETGCERWEWTFRQLVARDYNHPCIFAWVLFNETWGLGFKEYAQSAERQEWVKRMYQLAKSLDSSRLVEDNSACSYDHVITDINSWHFYINDYEQAKAHIEKVVAETYPGSTFNFVGGNQQGQEPLLNSEYGGISARMGDLDVSYCFKFLTDLLRKQEKICGYVYTELQDIEWECNGVFNYDRTAKDFGYEIQSLQGPVYLGVDGPPAQTLAPGQLFAPRVFVNRAGYAGLLPELHYRYTLLDSLGESCVLSEGSLVWPETTQPIIFADLPSVTINEESCLVWLEAWLPGLAANWAVAEIYQHGRPALEFERATQRWLLRKQAGDVEVSTAWHEAEVERGVVDMQTHLLGGVEAGHMDYLFTLPEEIDMRRAVRLTFLCEASSKRPGAPQTHLEGPGWPSQLDIACNGLPVHSTILRDQFADARGALSHLHGFRGRYGELVRFSVAGELLQKILAENAGQIHIRLSVPRSARHHRGLVIYSSRAGRYPCDVTLIVEMGRE